MLISRSIAPLLTTIISPNHFVSTDGVIHRPAHDEKTVYQYLYRWLRACWRVAAQTTLRGSGFHTYTAELLEQWLLWNLAMHTVTQIKWPEIHSVCILKQIHRGLQIKKYFLYKCWIVVTMSHKVAVWWVVNIHVETFDPFKDM